MHPLISDKRAELSQICQQYHIRKLEVFGSAARGTDFDPASSDADFLVEFAPGTPRKLAAYFAAKQAIEHLLRREVDLVEPLSIRNPYVLASINAAREIVYAA